MLPRFTEMGFDVVDVPEHIHRVLKGTVDKAIENFDSLRPELQVRDSIYGQQAPK